MCWICWTTGIQSCWVWWVREDTRMAMGRRRREQQADFWVAARSLPRSPRKRPRNRLPRRTVESPEQPPQIDVLVDDLDARPRPRRAGFEHRDGNRLLGNIHSDEKCGILHETGSLYAALVTMGKTPVTTNPRPASEPVVPYNLIGYRLRYGRGSDRAIRHGRAWLVRVLTRARMPASSRMGRGD